LLRFACTAWATLLSSREQEERYRAARGPEVKKSFVADLEGVVLSGASDGGMTCRKEQRLRLGT
jgi:hypothetical protein